MVFVAALGLGVIVFSVVLYFIIQAWPDIVRGVRIIWFIRARATVAFCVVYVLGGAPIGAHLFAVQANEQSSNMCVRFGPVLIADLYLFGFIIAVAGVVDALSLERAATAMVFIVFALITGFGNYSGMLDSVVSHPVGAALAAPAWLIFAVCALWYGWFKALSLYAAGSEDWEKAERERDSRKKQATS